MTSLNNQNIHTDLAQTITLRKRLFEMYERYFTNSSTSDVHSQLQKTIREHKQAMHHLYLKIQTNDSKRAA